jgi:hypothetical protein
LLTGLRERFRAADLKAGPDHREILAAAKTKKPGREKWKNHLSRPGAKKPGGLKGRPGQ